MSWTVAHQAPLSIRFPRQEYQSGLPFSSPGDLPDPGIKHVSPALAGRFIATELPGKPILVSIYCQNGFLKMFQLHWDIIDKWDFLGVSEDKESACNAGDQVRSLGQEDPLEKEIAPTLVFLPGKSNRQKSLVGCGPWGYKESDLIEQLTLYI